MPKTKIKVENIKSVFFVRQALNHDLVDSLVIAYETGQTVPPITINPADVLIDGRHRTEAAKRAGVTELNADVVNVTDEAAMLALAAKLNGNGPMPLLKKDYSHIVRHLQDEGMSITRIQQEILPFVPLTALRKLATEGLRTRDAQKWHQLRTKIGQGEPVKEAAIEVGLNPEIAMEQLGGLTRSFISATGNITQKYATMSAFISTTLKEWLSEFEAGRIQPDELRKLVDKAYKGANNHLNNLRDWERRIIYATSSETRINRKKAKGKVAA